ncbi:hypothetical protein ElyMa_006474500 [Elysia marginata]|uniref:Uncharacterized protein n=1 Tax=Elysia marginata TaxID=1093978 RepID=A0AAV4I221_9GAST|nr:hypothetical protein ElyMa_006474500 [Elysia marginata]
MRNATSLEHQPARRSQTCAMQHHWNINLREEARHAQCNITGTSTCETKPETGLDSEVSSLPYVLDRPRGAAGNLNESDRGLLKDLKLQERAPAANMAIS